MQPLLLPVPSARNPGHAFRQHKASAGSVAHRPPPTPVRIAGFHGPALFRPEVVAERQSQWLGTVLLTPRLSHALFAVCAAAALAAVVGLFTFAEYTKKARLNGWLVPEQGLVRVIAPQPGTVQALQVREGQEVTKDAPLLVLSTELRSQARGASREEAVRQLTARRANTAAERIRQQQLFAAQFQELTSQLATKKSEQKALAHELDLQRARQALADRNAARQRELLERHLVVEQRLQLAEEDKLDQAVKTQNLERTAVTLEQAREVLEATLRELPFKSQTQLADLDRQISTLDQQLAEAEAQREIVIAAPEDGTVTAIQAEPGGSVNTTVPLLSIVPAGTKLEARLFSNSRGIGFVRPGQQVRLRYQAFPYQKFGSYEGTVAAVSRTAVSPSELSQGLAGLTSLVAANEPVYEITVALASQSARAYGSPVALQPGMQLEADVMIERRHLYEWVLDPVYSLTGK